LAGLAGGGDLAFESLDGTEDGLEALRKWSRNAAKALKAAQAAEAAAKKRRSPPHAPAIAHLATLTGRNPGTQTLQAVRAQIAGFGTDAFEVGVLPPKHRSDLRPERTRRFTAAQLTEPKTVAWLRRMNSLDRDIYIRPAPLPSGQLAPLIFVDDLDTAQVKAMTDAGLPLAISIESSPGRFHGWVRMSSDTLTKTESNALARELAERFGGDPGAASWNQYGRLSGFTNRKESRRTDRGAPFAKLAAASTDIAPSGPLLLAEVRQAIEREQEAQHKAQRQATDRQRAVMTLGGARYVESAAGAFLDARRRIGTTRPDGSSDESARDFGAARELLRQGYEPENVAAAILSASPDVYDRHQDAEEYARRTAEAARRGLPIGRSDVGFRPEPR
jgi:hypothetical protein